MSNLDDDEALFEDLYDDDNTSTKKDTHDEVIPQEKAGEKQGTDTGPDAASGDMKSSETQPLTTETENKTEDHTQSNATTQSTEAIAPPPPPPSSIPSTLNEAEQIAANTQPGEQNQQAQQAEQGQPAIPAFPFDPAQFAQFANMAQMQGQMPGQMPGQVPGQVPGQMPSGVPPPPNSGAAPLPRPTEIGKESGKMFIGGLNWDTTEEGLVNYFSKFGEITDYTIMKDNATGRSRGFGFLTFKDPSAVDVVIKQDHILDGKLIDPKRAISREDQDRVGKIFIGGIDPMVSEGEFNEFFSKFGTIIDCQLMIDKDTGRSRGFGFITFDSPDAVDRVCVNKYLTLKGKAMEVKRAAPRGQHNQQVMMQQQQQAQQQAQQQGQFYNPYGQGQYGQMYPQMNPAMNPAMNQWYQWYMFQQAQAQQQQQQGGSSDSQPAQPLNPQQQADDPDGEESGAGAGNNSASGSPPLGDDGVNAGRPNIPRGPKRPNGPSNFRGRGGYRRGRGGFHPYQRGGRRY